MHSPVCVPNRRHFSGLPLRVDLVARVRKRWFQALEILQFLVLYPSKYLVYFFCCRKTWRGTQTLSYTSVDLHQPGNLTFKRLKTNKNFKFQRRGPPQRMARHVLSLWHTHGSAPGNSCLPCQVLARGQNVRVWSRKREVLVKKRRHRRDSSVECLSLLPGLSAKSAFCLGGGASQV